MKSNLRKFATVLSVSLLTAGLVLGATAEEQEFKQLREQRAKAAPGESEMRNQRYRWSLEQLLRRATPATQPELARQIQAELQSVAGAKAAAAATATPAPISAPAKPGTKADLKRLFENSQWLYHSGTAAAPLKGGGTCTFLKDGSFAGPNDGELVHCHFYEVAAPDVLKLYIHDPKKDRKAEYRALRVDFSTKSAKVDPALGGTAMKDAFIEYARPLK